MRNGVRGKRNRPIQPSYKMGTESKKQPIIYRESERKSGRTRIGIHCAYIQYLLCMSIYYCIITSCLMRLFEFSAKRPQCSTLYISPSKP